MSTHPVRSREAFFGRHKGKTLSPNQQALISERLPEVAVDLSQKAPGELTCLFDAQVRDVRLEIGFGGGEHLHLEAGRNPSTGFIGVEPFVNSMAKMLVALEEDPRPNLRLYADDATFLLDWLPDASLAGIDLFYPDPWPKKRHFKRRFVNVRNLDRFARVLKPGGHFRFASDIDTYVDWTLDHIADHAAFDAPAGTPEAWAQPYDGWPGTRYEAKALREGREPVYLSFVRRP
ncbi:tRNA (guanosine(46)-N7)-methyltransferase TrmB [Aureimonas fodinaquatilis]|uniref:tRNA (guanine-N(7)-)-methyltransferase n=2 Tax=Aureimonas fodinaquatilis TaxID=2565783 RepID=A0A5B0DP74_9HYPH|nr:tRNA (guanosine(46)-N(7))-methyltransferase TrmB [Aureimonas fodinaquatilis]KAA0968574.1 tRNA (guanosine(46)-N7)-methyltransferase TrmB [Aureimonas fodinaquatilis]